MINYFLQHKLLVLVLLALAVFAVILFLRSPSHDKHWKTPQARLPAITLGETDFSIAGVRDFSYNEQGEVTKPNYLNEQFNYADLTGLWFGLSHFGDNGLAHAFLSFEFESQGYLALSIEARLQEGQSYHPLRGLFRRYEKIYVFGTEADIVGLRSHIRGEPVLLYPIALEHAAAVAVLKHYLQEAQQLEHKPDFYNTLLDNCLTGILRASQEFTTWDFVTDTRVIFPGRSDALAHELGLIPVTAPLEELRHRARIDTDVSDPALPNFSRTIRMGWSE